MDRRTDLDTPRAPLPSALLERRRRQKRMAIERLLEWGFAESDIALILGCSLRSVENIRGQSIGLDRFSDEDPGAA